MYQWIGLRENLQESPIFNGKIYGFRLRFFRLNQSIDNWKNMEKHTVTTWKNIRTGILY